MLSNLFPTPIPFELGDDGRRWLALPLRVRDVATLENVVRVAVAQDFVIRTDYDFDNSEDRQAIREAIERIERSDYEFGSDNFAHVIFSTIGGRAAFLLAALRADQIDNVTALALAESISDDQWNRLDQLAWGVDAQAMLCKRVDEAVGLQRPDSEMVPWPQAVIETWQSTGLSLEAIGDLTLPALRVIRSGGIPPQDSFGDDSIRAREAYAKRTAFYREGQPGHEAIAWHEWHKLITHPEGNGCAN